MIQPANDDEKLRLLVEAFAQDPDVVGVWLGGSRAKGYATASSDYDAWVFLTEDAYAARQRRGAPRKQFDGTIEVYLTRLEELASHCRLDADSLRIRYAVAGTKPLLDKTGRLGQLIDELGTFPIAQQRELIIQCLDAYCNAFLRSVKAELRGDHLAALLQAVRSIDHLLVAVFALHERFTPFVEYLPDELPLLTKLPWRDGMLGRLLVIASTADVAEQQDLERDIERLFRDEGYGSVFASWEQTAELRWREALGSA